MGLYSGKSYLTNSNFLDKPTHLSFFFTSSYFYVIDFILTKFIEEIQNNFVVQPQYFYFGSFIDVNQETNGKHSSRSEK